MEPTYWLAKAIIKPWMGAWLRWSVEGAENIPPEGGCILAFNHIALLDPFAAAYVVDRAGRRPRFLAKSELFQDKRVSWILKGARQIEVRRGTREAPVALDHALRALEEGQCIVVFPEGTITTDPDLNPSEAKSGTARLALASQVPLIPCALWGTANVWPKGYAKRWWPPRQDILVRIGKPLQLPQEAESPQTWKEVSATLMDEITRLVASLRPAVPDRRRPKRRAA